MGNMYVPGVCNIGPAEIKLRRQSGIAGLIMTVVLFILIVVLDIPPSLRLLIALPVGLAATGFLQAKLHFCVRFGMAGLFNMSETALKHETIDQSKYRKKDQRKALIIISSATIITLVITIITYILPISTH